MASLLIRNVEPSLKRRLEENARAHKCSVSDEAKFLLRRALAVRPEHRKMGTALFSLVPEEFRGDDLVFEIPGDVSRPPDFD